MRRAFVALALTLGLADASLAAALTGKVTDSVTGRPIAGAKLEVLGRELVTSTTDDGGFVLEVAAWPATLVATRAGYRVARLEIAEAPAEPLAVRLDPVISYADRIEVTATRAREGIDPATFTNIPQERVRESYWGQDPAMLLPDLAPGFLAYNDSGNGIGYSYFTVRGFGQARTRVTLNGAPLNDAESGELFFIDLADFMSTAGDVQLSRGVFGLSGIGGSLDITTAPSGARALVHLPGRCRQLRDAALRRPLRLGPRRRHLVARGPLLEDPDGRLSRPVLGRDVEHVPLALALRHALDAARQLLRRPGADAPGLQRHPEERAGRWPHRERRPRPPHEPDHAIRASWTTSSSPTSRCCTTSSSAPARACRRPSTPSAATAPTSSCASSERSPSTTSPTSCSPDGTTIAESDLVRKRIVGEWDYGWVPTFSHRQGPFTLTVSGELRLHDAHHCGRGQVGAVLPGGDRAGPPLLRLPRQEGHRDRLGKARLGRGRTAHAVGRPPAHARALPTVRGSHQGRLARPGLQLRAAALRRDRPPGEGRRTPTSTSRAAGGRRTGSRSTIPRTTTPCQRPGSIPRT